MLKSTEREPRNELVEPQIAIAVETSGFFRNILQDLSTHGSRQSGRRQYADHDRSRKPGTFVIALKQMPGRAARERQGLGLPMSVPSPDAASTSRSSSIFCFCRLLISGRVSGWSRSEAAPCDIAAQKMLSLPNLSVITSLCSARMLQERTCESQHAIARSMTKGAQTEMLQALQSRHRFHASTMWDDKLMKAQVNALSPAW